ncbi:hypothetical protein F5B21DRAFT_473465 [Xylaria acuta]|nr:hypothetical protein F5B21DRAFT_473465 [Xylaria acuta]
MVLICASSLAPALRQQAGYAHILIVSQQPILSSLPHSTPLNAIESRSDRTMAPCRRLAAKPILLVTSSSKPSAQPNNRIVKQHRNHHTAVDWETKKQTIIQLYTRENRPAKDVIGILKSEFAFNTSRRQLFNKLNEWGVQKNKKRDAEYTQDIPEEVGGENSAVEPDNMMSGMSPPSEPFLCDTSSPFLIDDREIFGATHVRGRASSRELLGSPAQPPQTFRSCVDASPFTQFPQSYEFSLESLELRTPRLISDDDNVPPWRLQFAYSPRSIELAGPSTAMAIRRRSPSPAVLELHHQPRSKNRDVYPAASPQAPEEATTSMGRRTPLIHPSLEDGICNVIKFVTGKECTIDLSNAFQLKEDLRSLLDLTQSSLMSAYCSHHKFGNELSLVNSLISSAARIAINTNSLFRFPRYVLPEAHIIWKQRRTTVRIGTSILDVTTKMSETYPAQTRHDARTSGNDGVYTGLKMIFKPQASTFALQIEVNQCQLVDGSFSGIPRLSINNIVSNDSRVFTVAASGSVQDLMSLFASGQANIRDHDENGWSLLHHSLENPPMCQFLVESGLDIDEACYRDITRSKDIWTPLHICYYRSWTMAETARILLAGGADPTINTHGWVSVIRLYALNLEDECTTLLCDIFDLSAHFGVSDVRSGLGWTILLSIFSPSRLRLCCHGSFDPARRIECLLNRGSRINETDSNGSTCLHLFFRSWILPPWEENWLDALIYVVQRGADVYSADMFGTTVSQIAYAERTCKDSRYLGSYRGDLWDAVLHACGYNILEFRTAFPRRARYTRLYTRKDFESLWNGREHLCPYWDDDEWPAALGPDRRVTDLGSSEKCLCTCRFEGGVRWIDIHDNNTSCYYRKSYDPSESSSSDIDSDIAGNDDGDDDRIDDEGEEGEEAVALQGIQGLSSTHGFHEPGSPEDTEMQSFWDELDGLFDPAVSDA